MFSSQLHSSKLPECVYALGSQMTLANATAASGVMEASFYASLNGKIEQTTKFVTWIKETSIAHINTIQNIFILVNAAICFYSAKKLVDELANKFSISILSNSAYPVSLITFLAVAISLITMRLIENHYQLSPNLESIKTTKHRDNTEENNLLTCSKIYQKNQIVSQNLRICKIVMNIALAFLIKNRFKAIISVTSSIYCLWKETQLQWIIFSGEKQLPRETYDFINKAKISYHMLALPIYDNAGKEKVDCPICLENTTKKIFFCANHVFCETCISSNIVKNKDNFFKGMKILKKTTIYHNERGRHALTSHTYQVTIPFANLPNCPICRVIPPQNTCEFEVEDRIEGIFKANLVIDQPFVDKQPLFENLYAIYNSAQLILTYLQSYPKFTVTIFKIQQFMLITDLIGLAMTLYFLGKKIKEKYNPQDSHKKLLILGALSSMMGVGLGYAIAKSHPYQRSTINLNQILHQLGFSPELLKEVALDWHNPTTQLLMQLSYAARIVSITALSFFSKQWKQNLLTNAAQLISLFRISNLKWIKLTQTFTAEQIINKGGKFSSFFDKKYLENITLKAQFLINPADNIESTIKSILSCSNSFFNNSEWSKYWRVYYTNGIATRRHIEYSTQLQNNPFTTYSGSFLPSLTGYSIKLFNRIIDRVKY